MKKFISAVTLGFLPFIAMAQTFQTNQGLDNLLSSFGSVLSKLFPIAVAIAVLSLFYNIIMFIITRSSGDTAKHSGFKEGILYSVAAVVVMLTFFGIVRIIANTLGIGGAVGAGINNSDIPRVQIIP